MIRLKTLRTAVLLAMLFIVSTYQGQLQAQHIDTVKTHWRSYGFMKQVEQVGIGYYTFDSLGYEPASLDVYTFNKKGQIIQKHTRIFGKFASETANNYVYKNGKLDSLNTLASARNFNSKQKFHYNTKGRLDSITATGVFSNFTDIYSYENTGALNTIERKYRSGGTRKTRYNHKSSYVSENETDVKGKSTIRYYVYDNNELFASFELGNRPVVIFHNTKYRMDLEVEVNENALNYALKMRTQKKADPEAFQQQIRKMQGLSTSRVVFDIPAESTNETGDWTKRLQIESRYGYPEKRLVFKRLVYADGKVSGDTEFDFIFGKKVAGLK